MNLLHKKIGIIIGAIVAVIVLVVLTLFFTPSAKVNYSTVKVSPKDIVQTVTATGQVAGEDSASLAFDTSGTVARVSVHVGDTVKQGQTLGSLSSDILAANLESAMANVTATQATLAQLTQGNRPEAVAVYQQKATDAGITLGTAIHDAYLKTQDAIFNKTDTLFSNPLTANPLITLSTQNDTVKNNINFERLVLGEKLTALGKVGANDFSSTTQAEANDTLNYAKKFTTDLSAIISNPLIQISASNTATVIAAASEINTAMSGYVTAQSAYNEANNSLTLEAAGGTSQDVQAQAAKVAAAQAQADIVSSQINHTVIRAPFDGIITAVNLKIGEVATPGSVAFGIITKSLKIEVRVPENDISKIAVGDTADVTLDAYSSDTIFPAVVSEIDPAATLINGINSYKVKLRFVSDDPRIRSGMSANVSIVTAHDDQAIAVPDQAVITRGTSHFVLVEDTQGNFAERQVSTGITGSGYTAITSGIQAGDTIASFGNGNSNVSIQK